MTASTAEAPPARRAAIGFILVSVCLDVLSLGIVIPVLPPLIQRFEGGDAGAAGRFIGLTTAVWAVAQFFAAPVLGALSDRFGRRPVLLISLLGLSLDYLLMAFAPSLGWLFLGRVISGLTAAGLAVANAYIADVTPQEKRAATFGVIGAAWGVGFILGPSLGGVLGDVWIRLPFLAAAGLTMLGVVYGAVVLPESLAPENRARFAWAKANPVGSLSFLASHRELLSLSAVNLLLQFANNVLPTLFILYASNRYGWSLKVTGPALALVGVCNILVQGLLVRRVISLVGEWGALIAGLVGGGLGFALFGLAPNGVVFLAAIPVFALIGLFGPGYQGLITRRVASSEQGRLQGANASLGGLAGIAAPLTFGYVYAWFVAPGHPQLPGAGFLLAALLHAIAALIAVGLMVRAPRTAQQPA
ncbi:MAG: transporter [Phenylobacterium sp.]|nr:transporter [Phenylobacterium sp.]